MNKTSSHGFSSWKHQGIAEHKPTAEWPTYFKVHYILLNHWVIWREHPALQYRREQLD